MYPQAVALPFLSIIATLVLITPLVLHAKNRNFPAASILVWFILLNLFNIFNSFIWPNDDIESYWDGVGLCDIEAKVMIASYVAVPGGLLCVFRSLAAVLDTRCAMLVPTKIQRWKTRGMEILFCVFVPVASMLTHIVYQRSRYMIYGITGCINDFDQSIMSLVLSFIWPPIICVIASYYCAIVLYRLQKYRSQFGEIVNSSHSNLNKSRFLRLFFLMFTMLIIIFPIQCFVVYWNTNLSLPWHTYSWTAVHGPWFNHINKVPSYGQAFFDRWVPTAASFLVFVFFGCGKDAKELYRSYLRFLGLGHWFPSLSLDCNRRMSAAGSTGSRVKLLFHKRWSSSSRAYTANNTLTSATTTTATYPDVEKGMPTIQENDPHHYQNQPQTPWFWLRAPWTLLPRPFTSTGPNGKKNSRASLSLTIPSSSVHTNAWAGMSQSRTSDEHTPTRNRRDFIWVQQEISQESEMHEVV